MSPGEIATLATAAVGLGIFLRSLVEGVWKLVTGKQTRERSALQKAYLELDAERLKRDHEAAYARRVSEHAHEVRVIAIRAGVDPVQLPTFPTRTP